MADKRESYLFERSYKAGPGNKQRQEESQYWIRIIGKEGFWKVVKADGSGKIKAHLSGKPFEVTSGQDKGNAKKPEDFAGTNRAGSMFLQNTDKILFYEYYETWIKKAMSALAECAGERWEEEAIQDAADILISKLQSICIRTLVAEMNLCKKEGKLQGENEYEEYRFFTGHLLGDESYRKELDCIYPVMRRCVEETVSRFYIFFKEVFERLGRDQKQIITGIMDGKPFQKIRHIKGNISDAHRGGRTVLELELDNGCPILYKPHSLKNEEIFGKLKKEILKRAAMPEESFRLINRTDYGWVEKVIQKDCVSEKETENYFIRLGINLFLAYLLGTGDLHCENIIAAGEYPVFIDLEALIGIHRNESADTSEELLKEQIKNSVLSTGILPFYTWDKSGKGVDMSAVGGGGGQEYPIKVLRVVNPGRSDMHMEYQKPVSSGKKNQVCMNSQPVDTALYVEFIADGFDRAYQEVLGNKEEWKLIFSENLKQCFTRFLAADTQKYAMMLNGSYHPDLMMDGGDRELYLHFLEAGECSAEETVRNVLGKNEILDLLQNDIPYFTVRADDNGIYNSSGKRICSYFKETPLERVMRKLEGLSAEEQRVQQKLIYLAMKLMQMQKGSYLNRYVQSKEECFVKEECCDMTSLAEQITEELFERACINKARTDANWLGIRVVGQESRWSLGTLGMYLYDGLAGLTLYFFSAYQVLKKDKYQELAKILQQVLFRYTRECEGDPSGMNSKKTGAYEGEMSLVSVYLTLYELVQNPLFLEYGKRHCKLLEPLISEDSSHDILEGNAGAVFVLLKLYRITGEKNYLETAKKAGNRICESAARMESGIGWIGATEKVPLAGMAHGNSGILAALALLNSETPHKTYQETIRKGLHYENSVFCSEFGNWSDLRDYKSHARESERAGTVAWCHGAAGILQSRLIMKKYAEEAGVKEEVERDIQKGFEKMEGSFGRTGYCLCHGTFGNLWIYKNAVQEGYGESVVADRLTVQAVAALAKDWENMLPQEKENPGMLPGLSGIGYFLLRCLDPSLPDILIPGGGS